MNELLESLRAAVERLGEALAAPETDLHRDAAIQRFEFTFEIAWKTVQKTLRAHNIDRNSPKDCIKAAWSQGWIHDEEEWVTMMKDRNLTSHTYKEELAREVYSRLRAHHAALLGLLRRIEDLPPT